MRRLPLIATLSLLALPVLAEDAALLIGVERYDDLRRVDDATDILGSADSLRSAGYSVGTLANGSARDTNRLLERFATDAADADRLVVGLAGQFITDGERSWFLAEDANRPSPFGLGDAVSLETVMNVLAQAPGQAVLILGYDQGADAVFGDYLRQGVGDLSVPQGVTVIYGAPRFTDGVVNNAVAKAGADVMAFVRDSRRLRALGYQPDTLVMQQAEQADGPTNTPSARPNGLVAWDDAQEADTIEAYRNFIETYPNSRYVANARRNLNALENDPVRLAQLDEAALNLTRNERRAVQRDLTLLEFNTRGVDGIFGPGSRGAIRNWQQDNGFAQTSYLTRSQINRIDGQASRREAEIAAEQEREREQALGLDRDYWEETGARGNQAGYRAYLERYPEGIFADEAKSKLTVEPDTSQARAQERALNINPVLRRLIESRLAALGHNPGDIDGRFDRNTRRALARYQQQNSLSATGFIDQRTLARLLADTFGR
jgi:peptidoglycan hydrolase-like protein with peptidoglycan-binding domain